MLIVKRSGWLFVGEGFFIDMVWGTVELATEFRIFCLLVPILPLFLQRLHYCIREQ